MSRQFKVIVADDEKLIANNIARRIEESSDAFRVISRAGTGLEALEQVQPAGGTPGHAVRDCQRIQRF